MRLAALVLALTTACTSCAGKANVAKLPAEPAWPSLALIGRYGIAHACPFEGYTATAAHVAQRVFPSGAAAPLGYMYQQGPRHGRVQPAQVAEYRDLALLQTQGDEPIYYARAVKHPLIGDEVHWYEYTFRGGLHLVKRQARLTSSIAGHYSFSPGPHPGASGGCLFNASGQVVGVVTWGLPAEKERDTGGIAVSVLGRFGPPQD